MKKLLLAAVFVCFLFLPLDTDLGWHLRYGQQIFQNHQVFKTNQIGFFLTNYQWKHAYSLYQLLTFLFLNFFGFWSLVISNALLATAVFWLIIKTYPKSNTLFLTLSSIFLYFISLPVTNLGWRSQLFSFLGISFVYFFLLNKKRLIFLPLIFLFWANLHGGFVLGFVLFFFHLIEKVYQKEKITSLLVIILLSFLTTLINPFGFKIYQEIYRHTWYPLNQLIAEWVGPTKISILLIIISASTISLGLISQTKIKRLLKKRGFILLFFSYLFFLVLALKARRNLAVFGLSSIYFTHYLFKFNPFPKKLTRTIICLLFLTVFTYQLNTLPLRKITWKTICENSRWSQPCQATEYLKTNPLLCQNIYNTYEWGGYLAWHLPYNKTFVDGRMPTWPTPNNESPYTIYLKILQTQPDFNQKLLDYKADCLLIAKGTSLDSELKKNPQNYPWQIAYEDQQATIYTLENL